MPTTEQFATALAGRYTIQRQIGTGGMATVYLGHDVRHRRPVAVKFLNAELAAVVGAERFASEIQVTANLQHPHILPLFDSGEAALPGYAPGHGVLFYVMPYVDGETLRQRLMRERQLSIDEALRITRAVASALDYAHRHGVIHRDLKPENILLHDGEPLVADFGIALALSNAAGQRITQSGFSLGTPQYMSPEQAAGDRQLDARSDVYSLGTVLYEMLAGEPPHTGPTVQAVIANVISEPSRPVEQLRHTVPEYVSAALERALAKVPADRFATAGEMSAALTPAPTTQRSTPRPLRPHKRPRTTWVVFAVLGAVVGAAFGVAAARTLGKGATSVEETSIAPVTLRSTIDLPPEAPLALGVDIPNSGFSSPLIALSPNGAWLAWVAETSTGRMIYLRDMSTGDTRLLPGTEGAIYAFFSPDAKWIGFLTTDHVSKVPREGGAVTVLCDVATPVLAWWTSPDTIHVVADETSSILLRVSADGGTPERLAPTKRVQSNWLRFSDVLEGGRFALATKYANGGEQGDVVLVDLESGKIETLIRGAHAGRYVPPGHLIFARAGAIFEVRFDPARRTTSGDPVKFITGATTEARFGITHAAFSMNGMLVFLPGSDLSVGRPAWIDRAGKVSYIDSLRERVYGSLDLSPTDDRIAFQLSDVNDYFWIWDLARREGRRVAFQGWERLPVWSPDGRHLSGYTLDDQARLKTVVHDVNPEGLVGEGRVLAGFDGGPVAWSPTSDTILLADPTKMSVARISEPNRSEPARALVRGMYSTFSPDGRWIAYSSPRNGVKDIWLQSFPQGKAAGQISSAGGWDPRWLPSGSLFYRTGNRWWTTSVSTAGAPRWNPPRKVFETEDFIHTAGWSYDVSRDGRRLLVVKRTHPLVRSKIEVVSNWPALLELAH